MVKLRIGVDCGHTLSGQDTGAAGCGRREEVLTREVGGKVIAKLQSMGHIVIKCYKNSCNNLDDSLSFRTNTANNNNVDFYVSIHFNAFNESANGTEIWTFGGKQIPEATRALNNLVSLGYANRGIKDGSNLFVLRNTKAKAMLVECCFIDSQKDMNLYNADKIANAIVIGITGQQVKEISEVNNDSTVTIYNESIPDNNEIFKIPGTNGYIEQSKDGRLIIHKDRGNYIAIGKGFIDCYWNDNNGNNGKKRLGGK